MPAQTILVIYLVVFFLHLAWDIFLDILNLQSVERHEGSVPPVFQDHFDAETYRKSIAYTRAKTRFGIVSNLYSSAWLLLFILSGWFGRLDRFVAAHVAGSYTQGVVFILSLSVIFSVVSLPLSLYSTFVIEERFGFNRMTLRVWLEDLLKATAISALILSPLLYALLCFMDRAGSLWWIHAFFLLAAFQLLVLYLFPVCIAPLFNKFEPMQPGTLKEAIDDLARRTRFEIQGIWLMDGSKRSGHANAYFTGFGRNKRIVLFDTLVQGLAVPETVAVLAHEIGHEKKRHVKKSIAYSLALLLPSLWLLSLLAGYPPFFEAFGFDRVTNHGALTVFSFASSPITYFLGPLFSLLSRRFEYEADRFAVDAVGNYRDLSNALLCMSKKSLSNLTPHPLYSFFHYSHPTLAERLSAMRRHYDSSVKA